MGLPEVMVPVAPPELKVCKGARLGWAKEPREAQNMLIEIVRKKSGDALEKDRTLLKLDTMAAVLIAEFKNAREAELVARLIGTMPAAKVLQKGKNLEDMYFAELIKEGMKEKGTVNLASFKNDLYRRIGKVPALPE